MGTFLEENGSPQTPLQRPLHWRHWSRRGGEKASFRNGCLPRLRTSVNCCNPSTVHLSPSMLICAGASSPMSSPSLLIGVHRRSSAVPPPPLRLFSSSDPTNSFFSSVFICGPASSPMPAPSLLIGVHRRSSAVPTPPLRLFLFFFSSSDPRPFFFSSVFVSGPASSPMPAPSLLIGVHRRSSAVPPPPLRLFFSSDPTNVFFSSVFICGPGSSPRGFPATGD